MRWQQIILAVFISLALLAILVINDLISICVGQDFWQGASAHFRHLAASLNAPLSLNVVGLMSAKSFSRSGHVCNNLLIFWIYYFICKPTWHFLSAFLFQCLLFILVATDGNKVEVDRTRGFKASMFCGNKLFSTNKLISLFTR